ncbi:MAG TPA: DUF3619 family protein [Rhodoferax sp.]|jgi:hypothetical protein|nr:DUF3619 family protein [Rhodoferax sp.]HPW82914.1 DUF3619 family protein [Rhodoferax sp.]HQC84711.1 DUF3619 family protein [Rhodoferax sp.]
MTTHSLASQQQFEDDFGRAFVARLDDSVDAFPHDISERLKAARMQAISKRKVVKVQVADGHAVSGNVIALQPGGEHHGLWNWLGSLLPLVALVVGILVIDLAQDGIRTSEIADVDTELLTDDLPPAAYTDPGFTQYLRSTIQNN